MSFGDSIFSKPVTFHVEIDSTQDEILAENSMTLTPTVPALFIYENNPLYGLMFHREIPGTYKLEDKEVTFDVFPFFFDTALRNNSNLVYTWNTNAGESKVGPSVTYRVPEEGAGSSAVEVSAVMPDKIMPAVSQSFLVQFGKE
jgi:hypothetical protein